MNEFSNNQPENSHENENENVPVTENPDNENTDETNETLLPKSVNVEIHVEWTFCKYTFPHEIKGLELLIFCPLIVTLIKSKT